MTARSVRAGLVSVVLLLAVGFPFLATETYFVHIAALTGIYIILALSYDLVVGQAGVFSLAHPAFFGIGGYTAAILATRFQFPFLTNLPLGAVFAGLFAILVGIPAFRLSSRYSFAMATLGLALVMETVATNWDSLTRGPLCISGISNVELGLPGLFTWEAVGPRANYFAILGFAVLSAIFVRRVVVSRVGRALTSVREDEVLAASRGISPLRYKMMAFTGSAMLAGMAGVIFAHFIGVVCTTLFALEVTITLLVIEFLGGMGSLVGIIVGAVVFTAVPEYLRLAAQARPLIYGIILLLVLIYLPDGLGGLFERLTRVVYRRFRVQAEGQRQIDSQDEGIVED